MPRIVGISAVAMGGAGKVIAPPVLDKVIKIYGYPPMIMIKFEKFVRGQIIQTFDPLFLNHFERTAQTDPYAPRSTRRPDYAACWNLVFFSNRMCHNSSYRLLLLSPPHIYDRERTGIGAGEHNRREETT